MLYRFISPSECISQIENVNERHVLNHNDYICKWLWIYHHYSRDLQFEFADSGKKEEVKQKKN